MSTSQEFQNYQNYFHLWRWEGASVQNPAGIHCEDWPLYETSAAKELLMQRAQSYGMASISSFIRAFGELKREGAIRQIRSVDPLKVEPEFTLTAADYFRMPASQIVTSYRTDIPVGFRSAVDKLIREGLI